MPQLFLRIDLEPRGRIGPGKIKLLEAIEAHGSISGAGRALAMSYRRAWLLVEELNALFAQPVIRTQMGGTRGGGAVLTPFGRDLVTRYRQLEAEVRALTAERLGPIEQAVTARATPSPSRRGRGSP